MFICPRCGFTNARESTACTICGTVFQPEKKWDAAYRRSITLFKRAFPVIFNVAAGTLLVVSLYFGRGIFGSSLPALQIMPAPISGIAPAEDIAAPTVEAPSPIGQLAESNQTVSRNFTWAYRGRWSWEMKLPVALYDYYRSLPRPPTRNYSIYVTNPLDDKYVSELAAKLMANAKKARFNESQTIEFAAAFVQSLPYTADNTTTGYDEYPRYPVETMVDNGGDCEDSAILLGALLDEMGYGIVLINPPGHFAVGVKDNGNMTGSYWEYDGAKYYYIETTGTNWRIGVVPEQFKGSPATVYPLIPVPIVTHSGNFTSERTLTQVTLTVSNFGTAAAGNVTVTAGFDAGNDMLWNAKTTDAFALGPDRETTVKLQLKMPPHEHTRLVVQILVDGVLVDDSHSRWFETN